MFVTGQLPASLQHALGLLCREVTDDGQQWLVKLMHRSGPGMLRMLWRLLGNEQDVLDAYQECICHLAAMGGIRSVRAMSPYAYRTAANIAIEMIRRKRRRANHWPRVVARATAAEGQEDEVGIGLDRGEAVSRLRAALCRMPDHLREVVILRDLAELPYLRVAKLLGVGVATARVYRRHAIVRLAGLLSEMGEPGHKAPGPTPGHDHE